MNCGTIKCSNGCRSSGVVRNCSIPRYCSTADHPYAGRTNSTTARPLYILFAQSSEFEGHQWSLPRIVLCRGAVALGFGLPPQWLARRLGPDLPDDLVTLILGR